MPGQVFPTDVPRPTGSHGEASVFRALKSGLPEGWRAWHSLRLRDHEGWEGEGDFVVAIPGRGLLVLEVKGGRMELRDGHWFQNGERLAKPPRAQGLGFARKLVDAVERRVHGRPPFGVACIFPDVDFTEPPKSGDLNEVVLGRRELAWIGEALRKAADSAIPPHSPPPSSKWMHALHELWGETWVPHVRLDDRVEDAERRTLALNADQLRVLDIAEDNERARVTGGAGTGKTIVAAELCRRAARQGRRALYLCFTDALANAVDAQFAREFPTGDRPQARSLRRYAVGLLEQAGVKTQTRDSEFWKEVSLQAACDALPAEEQRPEFVVVDEGQDLEESDWSLVEQLSQERGLWVFHDPLQAFWRDRALPPFVTAFTSLRLPKQIRSPEAVERFARLYLDGTDLSAARSMGRPDPAVLQVLCAPERSLMERVRHQVDELRRQGARPADIAIVSLEGQTRSELFQTDKLGSHRLAHADDPDAGKQVIADTFLRFKGLERPFVIVTELDPSMPKYEVRMRIALTRATVALTIVCSDEQAKDDPRLAALGPVA